MADHTSESGAHRGGEGSERGPGMPRWVKIWGAVLLLVLGLLVLAAVLGGPGGHGPGRHASAAPAAAPVGAPAPGTQDPGRWP
ncbi:hypothetical protein ACH9EU_00265 [Kocuria sp. M1R5S2]|uniref:hypothetical protein n=1 Tax=Kocuria rhizosphaerae TaxID=3376285 RepID=UPI0037B88EAE